MDQLQKIRKHQRKNQEDLSQDLVSYTFVQEKGKNQDKSLQITPVVNCVDCDPSMILNMLEYVQDLSTRPQLMQI